jgi:hypothetical protein
VEERLAVWEEVLGSNPKALVVGEFAAGFTFFEFHQVKLRLLNSGQFDLGWARLNEGESCCVFTNNRFVEMNAEDLQTSSRSLVYQQGNPGTCGPPRNPIYPVCSNALQ